MIIDCKDERSFGLLSSMRSAQQNSKSVAIAIIDVRTDMQTAFKLGRELCGVRADFGGEGQVEFSSGAGADETGAAAIDAAAGEYSGVFPISKWRGRERNDFRGERGRNLGAIYGRAEQEKRRDWILLCAAGLHDRDRGHRNDCVAGSRRRAGIQFATITESRAAEPERMAALKSEEKHDPPIRCALAAIHFGWMLFEDPISLSFAIHGSNAAAGADCSVKTEGKVRVMDPELGMGIEFSTATRQTGTIGTVHAANELHAEPVAEVLVEPEGIDWDDGAAASSEGATTAPAGNSPAEDAEDDPLLELFGTWATISKEQFLLELEKHKLAGSSGSAWELDLTDGFVHQRREPRIAVSRPVEVFSQNDQASFPQNTFLDRRQSSRCACQRRRIPSEDRGNRSSGCRRR